MLDTDTDSVRYVFVEYLIQTIFVEFFIILTQFNTVLIRINTFSKILNLIV